MIRVAVVDNHEVVREGIASRLGNEPDLTVVAATSTVEELVASGVGTDVALLDLWLDDGASDSAIPALVDAGVAVLLYTSEQRPVPLRRTVAAGASGVLLKSDPLDSVVEAVRQAAAGEFCCSGPLAHALLTDATAVADLSARQVHILQALADGLDYRAVSRLLGLTEGSIKTHLSRTREKFRSIGIEPGNALDLVRLAREQGHMT